MAQLSKNYDELLERLYANLPEKLTKHERFEIPKVRVIIQGNKTLISNFIQIAKTFNRDEKHFMKYLLRELASSGTIQGGALILNTRKPEAVIQKKVEDYANSFVLCKECKRPDTVIIKENDIKLLKCNACGAKHPINEKI